MLSFDSSIQKSADLKTQSSSGSWVERVLLTPYQHRRMNFQWPLLLNPLKKTLWGRWGCRRRPLVHLFGDNFEKLKQKNFVWFFLSDFFLFFRFFWLFIFFSVASSVSSSSKTLWRRWKFLWRPHWHFFGGNF